MKKRLCLLSEVRLSPRDVKPCGFVFFAIGKRNGGERGIRTPDTRKGITVFETAALGHSAISPQIGPIICRLFFILQADFRNFSAKKCPFPLYIHNFRCIILSLYCSIKINKVLKNELVFELTFRSRGRSCRLRRPLSGRPRLSAGRRRRPCSRIPRRT